MRISSSGSHRLKGRADSAMGGDRIFRSLTAGNKLADRESKIAGGGWVVVGEDDDRPSAVEGPIGERRDAAVRAASFVTKDRMAPAGSEIDAIPIFGRPRRTREIHPRSQHFLRGLRA